uniref:uncharacterized protein LOC108950386 n=1 Tax=Ciona intestinalis TaxID=7719 RepID=UPI000EF4C84C|nr:uncharacterized protein LOC108950386 [Ciona intestinalis]|eukprot:XP_018671606.2 uncharacterized protein LOC108950386 [Ciona intestinalis]
MVAWQVVDEKPPRQINGIDCGIHVIANAFCILNRLPYSSFNSDNARSWVVNTLIKSEPEHNYTVSERKISNSDIKRIVCAFAEEIHRPQITTAEAEILPKSLHDSERG